MPPSMQDVLASIPGYGGYIAKRQMNEGQPMQEINQAGALVGLQQKMEAAKKAKAFETEVAALGENPDQGTLAQLAAKYATPHDVITTQQRSLDRQATTEATRASREATLAQAAQTATQTHEFRMSQAKTAEERTAETARHHTAMEGLQREIAQLRVDAGRTKPPAGYRMKSDGNLEAIPGGPADTKLLGAFNADTANIESSTSGLNRMATSANELLNHPGLPSITGMRGAIPNIPGTQAADAQAKLENLKSQVGFSVLQAMRDASKTGGALGNVSDAEGKRLEANLAALQNAQSLEQFKTELGKILTFTSEAKDRLRSAYNLKHGDRPTGGAPGAPGAPAAPQFREGQTATGPGGQKIIFKGGQWQPVTSR